MKKKWVYVSLMTFLLLLTLSNTTKKNSTGAPVGSTGAPGETNCARSGCHTGTNNLNTGIGKLNIEIEDYGNGYVSEKSYRITVSLMQDRINRFGFSSVVLNNKLKSVGDIEIEDENRTQVLSGSGPFEDRNYITYKALGTNPHSKYKGEWVFNWKAPETNEGPVTIYLAAVAANNDGTDKGDEVYTDSITLNPATTGVNEPTQHGPIFSVYPNPIKSAFVLSWKNKSTMHTVLTMESLDGKTSMMLHKGVFSKGEQRLALSLPTETPAGIYLLHLKQGSLISTQKIIVNP